VIRPDDRFHDMRDLCRQIPDEYFFRKIDEQRSCLADFADALTKAGWLAALKPVGPKRSRIGLRCQLSLQSSLVNPDALTMGRQYNLSSSMIRFTSVPGSPVGSRPMRSTCARTCGLRMAARRTVSSFATTSFGVPAGTNAAYEALARSKAS